MAHGYKHTTRRPWRHNQSFKRSEVVDETTLLQLIGRPTVNDIQREAREAARRPASQQPTTTGEFDAHHQCE